MTGESRREFIRKLAGGAAYSAPVFITMAAPRNLAGQGGSSAHHDGGGHGDPGHGMSSGATTTVGPPPPGATPRPGITPQN